MVDRTAHVLVGLDRTDIIDMLLEDDAAENGDTTVRWDGKDDDASDQ